MQKVNYLILLFLGISSFLLAQTPVDGSSGRPKIGAQNWQNTMNNEPGYQQGCVNTGYSLGIEDGTITVKASIRFYLGEVELEPNEIDGVLDIYPDMFLAYNFQKPDGTVVSSDITEQFTAARIHSEEWGISDVVQNGNAEAHLSEGTTYLIYVWEIEIIMGVGDYTGVFEYSYDFLTKTPKGKHIPYPICLFAGSGELFDGCIFEDTYYVGDCYVTSYNNDRETPKDLCTDASWGGTKDLCNEIEPFPALAAPINTSHIVLIEPKHSTQESNTGNESKILVSPNPFNGNILIKTDNNFDKEIYSISVFDISGKRIWSINQQNGENTSSDVKINTSDWPAGVYFIQLATSSSTETKQMVKVNK